MKKQEEKRNRETINALIQCAQLILPWLTHQELANISLTCKTLCLISKTVTLRRSSDASRSFETHPIPFHNTIDQAPYAFFLYTPSQLLHSPLRQPWGNSAPSSGAGGRPTSPCGCDCDKVLGLEEVVMSECGPSCRLSEKGVSVRLKIVRDKRKGWGLYADQLIHKGQFVCEYAGELLTTKEARSRQQIYDELASVGQFSSALLVVREHLPSGKACLRINIDATMVGNVARFINHSCDGGNLSTVLVRSSGVLLPRICFFASKDIKEGEELTFSYGEIRVRSEGLQCFCGSSCCFGILPAEHT